MIRVIDIPLHDSTLQDAVASVASSCENSSSADSHCISATGAHGLVEARKSPAFGQVLKEFAINLPDGVPVVWLARLKGARAIERCYGPDFFRDVMVATASKPVKHFFCGGKEGIAAELKQVAEASFGNNNCVGTFSPPFREMTEAEWEKLSGLIEACGPQIVWIGMSTPKQEFFAHELSKRVQVNFIITIGAAFDIHTGHLRQAPRVVQRWGLEWLFRLAVEPRRLWRRYARVVPLFIYYSALDLLVRRGPAEGDGDGRGS
jgi:N-acetylglucosaminyldiphosphoundecaprenol N-acetyl-beta-D-mannosaminyltransferase